MRGMLLTLAATLLMASPTTRAGDDKDGSKGDASKAFKIHGIVAGVTVEGETVIDPKNNTAVTAEDAFLTVVGRPAEDMTKGHEEASKGDAKSAYGEHNRHNVYMIWLSPKTKVCQKGMDSGKPGETKECTLDKLEIGDRVEIEYRTREDSASNSQKDTAKAQEMRNKHGRHRTYHGYATAITIMPHPDMHKDSDHSSKESKESSTGAKK